MTLKSQQIAETLQSGPKPQRQKTKVLNLLDDLLIINVI